MGGVCFHIVYAFIYIIRQAAFTLSTRENALRQAAKRLVCIREHRSRILIVPWRKYSKKAAQYIIKCIIIIDILP